MAGVVGVSEASVRGIRHAHGLQPYASGSEPLRGGRVANWFEARRLKIAGCVGIPRSLCTLY